MIEKLISRSWLSALGLTAFIILLPFQWFRLSALGNRSIVWLAIAALAVVAVLTFKTTLLQSLPRFIWRAKLFHGGMIAYIFVYLLATFLGDAPKENIVPIIAVYAQFLLVGGILENLNRQQLGRVLTFALPAAFLVLFVYANFVFISQGTNLFTELGKALSTGSHKTVTNRVVRAIVESSVGENPDPSAREAVTGSIRNFFGSFVSLSVFALLCYLPMVRRSSFVTQAAVACTLMAGPIILLVVLMSRSSILSIGVGLGVACLMFMTHSLQVRTQGVKNMAVGLVALVLIVAGVLPLQLESTTIRNTLDRFTEISSDMRVQHYQVVFSEVLRHPWAGSGAAELAPDGYQVHNYFLGAWYQVGILGLLVTLLAWCGLLADASRLIFGRWQQSLSWRSSQQVGLARTLNVYFACALLAGPLLRRFFAGDCGRFTLVELFAIALFFGCVGIKQAKTTEATSIHFLIHQEHELSVKYPRPGISNEPVLQSSL